MEKKKRKENPTKEITLNIENKREFIPRTEKVAFQKHHSALQQNELQR